MSSTPIAVGVMLPRNLPATDFLPFARRADELGFDELWVVEDLGFHGGIAQAAAALAATERIRVGIGILPVAARNVGFAAMDLATLAGIFPGRLEIGLGHGIKGWMSQVGAWPASPMTLLREQIVTLRALLAGETVTFDGRYVQLDAVRIDAPPAVAPPIYAGVRGPRSLALSGELADGTILAEPITPEYLRTSLDLIAVGFPSQERAASGATTRPDAGTGSDGATGADPATGSGGTTGSGSAASHRVVTYNAAFIDDDVAAARAVVRPGLEFIGEPDWAVHIDPLPFAEEFRQLRAESGSRLEFTQRMPDEWVDQLAIAGPPDVARAHLDAQLAGGVSTAVLIPAGPDPLAALDSLARVIQR